MSDSTPRALRLAALSPLLAAAASLDTAIALAIVLLGTLVFTAGIGSMLRRHLPENQRPIAIALIAAVVATALDLALQAFCYRIAQPVHDWLPLLAMLPALFDRAHIETRSPAASLRDAFLQAFAFGSGLFAGAALRSLLPLEAGIAACLIASGLALALVEHFVPQVPIDASNKPKSARARVTGPLR